MVIVDAKEIAQAIRSVGRMARKNLAGEGLWSFDGPNLTIDWAGSHMEFDAEPVLDGAAEDVLPDVVALAEGTMRGLGKALRRSESVRLKVQRGRLYFDGFSVVCAVRTTKKTGLSAINASPLDIFLLRYRHSKAELEAGGLSEQVASVEDRARETAVRAAKPLEWLGVDARLLGQWLSAHLEARADGRESFDLSASRVVDRLRVVEPDGQLRLLE